MIKQNLRVSIVIPVYNEGDSLLACLRAIEQLEHQPLEVIVVDNNSTDNSCQIASSFDFVRLVKEPKQGVVHARSCGFNAARADIIARIDADTIIKDGWLERIIERFSSDPQLTALSGPPDYYDFMLNQTANRIDRIIRKFLAKHLAKHLFLYGSNMAIRRSAWRSIRESLCNQSGIHEDLDLAIHLQLEGFRVAYDQALVAGVSMRRFGNGFTKFVRYTLVSPRTYASHDLFYYQYVYPVIFLCWLLYLPAHLLLLGYDQTSGSFSFQNFLVNRQQPARVDPSVNVA